MRFALLIATVLLVTASPAEARTFKVVQANVGNINVACGDERFKLCQAPVEARATRALRALEADVVAFQELLPDRRQAARLLGRGFRISCDSRHGWDCLAVRRSSGLKVAKPLTTRPAFGKCDDGFTMNTARLAYRGMRVAVTNAHPHSTDVACRTTQVRDLFKRLPARGPILALGDWNLDPYREDDASVTAFDAARERLRLRLASGDAFTVLPGVSQLDPTGTMLDSGTSPFAGTALSDRTIDHVLVRGFRSTRPCEVKRVDGGGGMDHRAQVCRLKLRAS